MRRIQAAREGRLPIQLAFKELFRLRSGSLRDIEIKYAKGMAKSTGLSFAKIIKSKPFKNFQKSLLQ